jgi:hypothetical protein
VDPEEGGAFPTATAGVVEDLVLTDAFLIKGRVERKSNRLSKLLDASDRRFLAVRDAAMIELRQGQQIRTPRVLVNMDQVILAHELVDVAGDYFQKTIAVNDKVVKIRAFYSGATHLEIAGLVSPGAYDSSLGNRRFFVMAEPRIRGIDLDLNPELQILAKLPYAILQKDRLAYVYDFT